MNKSATILAEWTERDLTAAAAAGELPVAWEMELYLEQLGDLLDAGRHPIVVGEPGVGKSALVYELVRRAAGGEGPRRLAGKRVLQLSLRHRLSGLRKADDIRPKVVALMEALDATPEVVPFFRDLDVAWAFDLEPQFQAFAGRTAGPILAEGVRGPVLAMLEGTPQLADRFTLIDVEEPDLDTAERILTQWSAARSEQGLAPIAVAAREQALELTHRFLPRARLPRKALDLLTQTAALTGEREVGQGDVVERFCRTHRVPRLLVDPEVPLDLGAVEERFLSQVLGQDEAVAAVLRMVALIKAGLSDVRRPFGTFLFVGPTGVGKTHLAQLLAEFLFGRRDRLVRFNMADFQRPNDALTLLGDPDQYLPHLKRGLLTMRLLGHPFAVLLLDELEKAHETVHDRFLQLIDEGSFQNGAGEQVSCRSTIVIATSNQGADAYRGHALGFEEKGDLAAMAREVDRALRQKFRFEFLNRFDQIVHFHPLSREHIRTIARRELAELARRSGLARRGVTLEVEEEVVDWLALHGYDPLYGARILRRTLEREVATVVAAALVGGNARPGSTVTLGLRQGRPAASLATPAAEREPRARVVLPEGPTARLRSLDATGLVREAEALLAAAAPRLGELAAWRTERAELLARLNEADAWTGDGSGYELLPRFRELDVAIRAAERLARPFENLAHLLPSTDGQPPRRKSALAGALETAARAFADWNARLAEEGPAAVWLVVANADPLRGEGNAVVTGSVCAGPAIVRASGRGSDPMGFVGELAAMELAWCRRLGLQAALVAHDVGGAEPELAALAVEGPGAAALLVMEQGLHRRAGRRGQAARARVLVVPQSGAVRTDRPDSVAPAGGPATPRTRPLRRRRGLLGLELAVGGRLTQPDRGWAVDLGAADAATLAQLIADLTLALPEAIATPPELARTYGESGGGARDPRTGARVARLKDALRGELSPLLEAWRRRDVAARPLDLDPVVASGPA